MKNIPFVIWMLGYPFLSWVCKNYSNEKKQYSVEVEGLASFLTLAIWALVGHLLYEKV